MLCLFGDSSRAVVEAKGLCPQADLCSRLGCPFASCVSGNELFHFTQIQSPHLKSGEIKASESLAICED